MGPFVFIFFAAFEFVTHLMYAYLCQCVSFSVLYLPLSSCVFLSVHLCSSVQNKQDGLSPKSETISGTEKREEREKKIEPKNLELF